MCAACGKRRIRKWGKRGRAVALRRRDRMNASRQAGSARQRPRDRTHDTRASLPAAAGRGGRGGGGLRLDCRKGEARLKVEIVGNRAMLKVEVDEAGRGLRARATAVKKNHRRLY